MKVKTIKYDVIIVGGSYSGLSAAMALGRALKRVLIIDGGKPCNWQTPHSHNFLTQDGKTPKEISGLALHQVKQYKTIDFLNEIVTKGRRKGEEFEIIISTNEIFCAKKIILATGIKDIMPNIEGFLNCWGISVLHCPYCHGYEISNEPTGILGNGAYGFEFSKLISNWTKNLTLFTNGTSLLTDTETAILKHHHITIIEKDIEKFEHHNGHLQNIIFKDQSKNSLKAIYAKPAFEQNGSLYKDLGCTLTEEGYIQVDAFQKTTSTGVFACGDNCTRMRTVSNSVYLGTTAGIMVSKELIEETF